MKLNAIVIKFLGFMLPLSLYTSSSLAQYIPHLEVADPSNFNDYNQPQEQQKFIYDPNTAFGDTVVLQSTNSPISVKPSSSDTTINTKDGGWQALANILKKLEPSTDTSIPETRTQATQRINQLINQGKYALALNEIKKLETTDGYIQNPGVDVQLQFLKGRALAHTDQLNKAIEVYKQMTYHYPELAEPWNNLATILIKIDSINEAYEALEMAIKIRPNYGIAQKNLALVQLYKAKKALTTAQKSGQNTTKQLEQIDQILNEK